MFSRIPQRFTAPFGLLGDEAKLAFRSQPGGISKLSTTHNIPETDSYWDQYITLFDSASDVFSLITPHDIRRAYLEAPENIATLVKVVILRLFNLVSDHTFPTPGNGSVTAFASSIIKAGAPNRNTTKEVLNCLRLLQRVLPVIFEGEPGLSFLEKEVLWKTVEVEEDEHDVGSVTPQFVIEDEDSEGEDEQPPTKPDVKAKKVLPSLAERLFSCLVDLLFCCGFTLPTKIQVDHYKISYAIWEKGIGSTADLGPNSSAYDSNKTEVLRLLLVLLSRQIYSPPGSLFTHPSLYSLHICQKTPRRHVLTVLCSLINTVMNVTQPGVTIGAMAGKLPYNHLVFKGEDPRLNLVSTSFQVLSALLDFQSGSARDNLIDEENQTYAPTLRTNAFRYFIAKLHRSQDFAFLLNGIILILEQEVASMNNLLPGAHKSAPYVIDNVIFFWKLIELNKKFRSYALESEKAMDLLAYLLCFCLEIKDKPQQNGLCRALSYIIQALSTDPAFGAKLSNPIKAHIPSKWTFPGNAADFLVNAVYSIVATTSGSLSSVYPALIISLSNAAPYFKHLSINSSVRLTQLFTSISNPLFLLADESHPRLLFFMLEVFNAVIFHHLSDNPNLVYSILTSHKTFQSMGTFTLARALRDIKRIQSRRDDQTTGNDPATAKNEHELHDSEKSRLQETEAALAPIETTTGENITTADAPASPISTGSAGGSVPSEKARGKMKARRSNSLDTSRVDPAAAAAVGRNGFVPTQEWVTSWQQGLPLDPILIVISELLPKVQDMQAASRHKPNSTATIMEFLENVTLKHVLPQPPPLAPKRFVWSDSSIVWLTSLIWGEIFIRGMSPLGIWSATNIKLFYVKHAPQTPGHNRQLTETVSNVVGGLLGRTNSSGSDVAQPIRH